MNLEDYTLIHKADHQNLKLEIKRLEAQVAGHMDTTKLKLEIKRLEAQVADLMDTTELKLVWAAEGAIKKMNDFLKAGQQLADRRNCTCVRYADALPTKPCAHCSMAISNWKHLIGEAP